MNAKTDHIEARGISFQFNPIGGNITDLTIDAGDGQVPLRPLHTAPWVTGSEKMPDNVALVERQLAGDFFCAPFGKRPGVPIHGWTANGTWRRDGVATGDHGAQTTLYRLSQKVEGAEVVKELTVCPDHPFVYQRHCLIGGSGHFPIAHHAMVHVPGGAKLSFSSKSFGVAPETPVETDPNRGRSVLAYPQKFQSLSEVQTAAGGHVDASFYPFDQIHEDALLLVGEPGARIGWSAALAKADGFLFFAVKDAKRLPETMLWMSNGGRSYSPWLGRHTGVLGIEEIATSCHQNGRFESTGELSPHGVATGLVLGKLDGVDIRYGFGAIQAPSHWGEVVDIRVTETTVTLVDRGGDEICLPFLGSHFLGDS